MTTKTVSPFRLAFRCEGRMWNAYIAPPNSMEGAELIGSILLAAAENPAIRDGFLRLMQSAVTLAIKQTTGAESSWDDPVTAPEHERAGHA
jgi:hypothetical protein